MPRPERIQGGHLLPDRVAACEAGEGTLPERAHLRWCAACREEVAAMARVRLLAQGLHDVAPHGAVGARDVPPLTRWEALAPRLRAEGLLREVAAPAVAAPAVAAPAVAAPAVAAPAVAAPAVVGVPARGGPAAARRSWMRPVPVAAAAAVLAAAGLAGWRVASPRDAADARRMVAATAVEGMVTPWDGDPALFGAAAPLGDAPEAGSPPQPLALQRTRARLAALDQLLAASQAALQAAPDDPVLQRSVEQAHAAREAALRQLGGTLPVSQQLVRY